MPQFRGHMRNYFADRTAEQEALQQAMEEQQRFREMFEEELERMRMGNGPGGFIPMNREALMGFIPSMPSMPNPMETAQSLGQMATPGALYETVSSPFRGVMDMFQRGE